MRIRRVCLEVVAITQQMGRVRVYLPAPESQQRLTGKLKPRGTNSHLRSSQRFSRCRLPNGCVWKAELSFVKVLKFGVSFLLVFFRSTHNILCLSTCRYINEICYPSWAS
jgi:hypothetical protein